MTRTEDRLTDALSAAASTVQEDRLRPLTVPGPGRRRPGWLAPVAAAVGVALVIGLAVLAAQVSARHAAPEGLPPGTPSYYVQTGVAGGRPVVRSTATGAVAGTVPVPASNALGYDLVTVDRNGTFFVVAAPALNQGERLYKFRLTRAGRVTGFAALPVGALASTTWAADALAVSPDGSRIALGMRFVAPPALCGHGQLCPHQPRPDYVLAINLATGARTAWRWHSSPVIHSFSVASLSWTRNDRELVLFGQWCEVARTNQTCARGGHLSDAEALYPADGDGWVGGHPLFPEQGPPRSYIVQAQISPDGTSVTVVTLRGVPSRGRVPRHLSVERISVAPGSRGQVLAVLYQRRLSDTFDPGLAPDFITLGQDATGQHLLLSGGGFSGWIDRGRLVPLTPGNRGTAAQAW